MSDAADRHDSEPAERTSCDPHRRMREAVSRVLDDDGFVLGVGGALEAVAEHARLRAMDEETFVERARAAYRAVVMEHAPKDGIEL